MRRVPKVFLSYASENEAKASRLQADLAHHDIDAWFARDELEPGDELHVRFRSAIREADVFLACLSEAYVERFEGSWLQRELTIAVDSERQAGRRIIIPVRLEVPASGRRAQVPEPLGSRAYADLSTDERWEKNLPRLVAVIRRRAAERVTSS